MYELKIKGHFSAAHYLPNYEGKCKNLHGHTWKYEVIVRAKVTKTSGPEDGMVCDFSKIKDIIDSNYDHKCLNNFISNPTAENIAKDIYFGLKGNGIETYSVTVWESDNCSITYTLN